MLDYMTIDQIVAAAENDATRQQENGTLHHENDFEWDGQHGENVFTLVSLYSQWAKDTVEAEDAIWTMFRDKFSKFLN